MNKHLPLSETFGGIKTGQKADLILVEGNPLNHQNISNIAGVMKDKEWFDKKELAKMRENIARKYRTY